MKYCASYYNIIRIGARSPEYTNNYTSVCIPNIVHMIIYISVRLDTNIIIIINYRRT